MNLEKRAIDQLAALPQPITVNGGSYAYSANVKKDPYKWQASDGSPIIIKSLKELGEYLDRYIQEDWDEFLEDGMDAQDLIELGYLRTGSAGAYAGQADFEGQALRGDSYNPTVPEFVSWTMSQAMRPQMQMARRKLGLEASWSGYSDSSSTKWTILFYNTKRQSLNQIEDDIRDLLGFDGWMEIEDGSEHEAMFDSKQPEEEALEEAADHEWTAHRIGHEIYNANPNIDVNSDGPPSFFRIVWDHLVAQGWDKKQLKYSMHYDEDFFQDVVNGYTYYQKNPTGAALEERETTMTEDSDMTRLLKLAGMYHKPQVFETEENKEGEQSPLSDVTDFVANVRGEKAKDPDKFNNADGSQSVLSEDDVEEGWDPFQDELEYDDQSQEDFPGCSRRFANPGSNSSLYAAGRGNPRIYACPTCERENVLTARDMEAGYQCDRCADAAEGIGMGSYGESIEEESPFRQHAKSTGMKDDDMLPDPPEEIQLEDEMDEDFLAPPPKQADDSWYDADVARREMARMGANPEFTGKHEIQKPHLDTPAGAQAAEDEWIVNQNAEHEQMAAMDDWDVFNKQGVEEEGDLGNGYGDNHVVDGEDFFPSGATSNVVRKVGPSGARHGDNPMAKAMATESAKLHEKYLRDFSDFKKKMK